MGRWYFKKNKKKENTMNINIGSVILMVLVMYLIISSIVIRDSYRDIKELQFEVQRMKLKANSKAFKY